MERYTERARGREKERQKSVATTWQNKIKKRRGGEIMSKTKGDFAQNASACS